MNKVSNVKFTYEQIKSIEVYDSKAGIVTLTPLSITFKVDGQKFNGMESQNPYKIFFSAKKREQPKLIKDEIYKRIQARKNQNNKGSILHADELKKFVDLKWQGILNGEEFNAQKNQILGL